MSYPILPPKNASEILYITPNAYFQWLFEGRAFSATLTAIDRDSIDAYLGMSYAVMALLEAGAPILSLQDISHKDITLTPYFRQEVDRLSQELKAHHVHGHGVVLLDNGIMGRILAMGGNLFRDKEVSVIQHYTTDRQKAMDLLRGFVMEAYSEQTK